MELEKNLELFKKIEKLEVPPFLFAKVMHEFEQRKTPKLVKSLSWTLALAASLLLILNVSVWIKMNNQKTSSDIKTLANSLELGNNNNFYHDQN
ncbi:MAG: hypothetical protein KKE39_10240 [Bacteroidetes bacterium]|nr:hypothetical protein [Bacteroidota bacterium]MBU1371107.1 hypothetical protein [Bacteroidota bacterium]MBU1486011.1 hypothetical protein [Bacteroidota bacterium]MBU1759390.1 hypothetical protein [Bacteroidota bacterium]MBU2045216.1 hypothetical protein [Bacteroidota bacterium]